MRAPLRLRARRVIGLVLAAAAVAGATLGGTAVASAASPTAAAWNDRTAVSAVVASGTWVAQPVVGCAPMTPSGWHALGSCTVTYLGYTESGAPGSRSRVYTVVVHRTLGHGYAHATVDLSSATGPASGFAWQDAAVLPGSTVLDGWSCWAMPLVEFDTPTGFTTGLVSYAYTFTVTERGSASPGSCT